MNTQPVLLKPAFKDYLWGGTRLRTEYGKDCDLDRIPKAGSFPRTKTVKVLLRAATSRGKPLPITSMPAAKKFSEAAERLLKNFRY